MKYILTTEKFSPFDTIEKTDRQTDSETYKRTDIFIQHSLRKA